ncbi:MAG: adenylyltransferase/cytidyltransferase family protein [bacterium]|nr:adenylyltransferase/cytidyltransferase family protein [bacterium]
MNRVVAFGVFDGLHPGHIAFLRQARALGDELIIVATQDAVALMEKGRAPALSVADRCMVLEALAMVDRAVPGDPPGQYGDVLRELAPDVIAIGYDQRYDAAGLQQRLVELGLHHTRVVQCESHGNGQHHTSTLGTYAR